MAVERRLRNCGGGLQGSAAAALVLLLLVAACEAQLVSWYQPLMSPGNVLLGNPSDTGHPKFVKVGVPPDQAAAWYPCWSRSSDECLVAPPLPPYDASHLPDEFFYYHWASEGTVTNFTGEATSVDRTLAIEVAIEGAYLNTPSNPKESMVFVRFRFRTSSPMPPGVYVLELPWGYYVHEADGERDYVTIDKILQLASTCTPEIDLVVMPPLWPDPKDPELLDPIRRPTVDGRGYAPGPTGNAYKYRGVPGMPTYSALYQVTGSITADYARANWKNYTSAQKTNMFRGRWDTAHITGQTDPVYADFTCTTISGTRCQTVVPQSASGGAVAHLGSVSAGGSVTAVLKLPGTADYTNARKELLAGTSAIVMDGWQVTCAAPAGTNVTTTVSRKLRIVSPELTGYVVDITLQCTLQPQPEDNSTSSPESNNAPELLWASINVEATGNKVYPNPNMDDNMYPPSEQTGFFNVTGCVRNNNTIGKPCESGWASNIITADANCMKMTNGTDLVEYHCYPTWAAGGGTATMTLNFTKGGNSITSKSVTRNVDDNSMTLSAPAPTITNTWPVEVKDCTTTRNTRCRNRWNIGFSTLATPGEDASLWALGVCSNFTMEGFRAATTNKAKGAYLDSTCNHRWSNPAGTDTALAKVLIFKQALEGASCINPAPCALRPKNSPQPPDIPGDETSLVDQKALYVTGKVLVIETLNSIAVIKG